MKRLGVVGSMVWDTIYGRDPAQPAVQEWGGIAYALAAFDATLPEGWAIVPLIKVGRDLATKANQFLHGLRRTAHGSRFIEVPDPNNRVTLRYVSAERRCEWMEGGVPGWTWGELGPLVRDLDALYVNFISGFEVDLETARLLRRGFRDPIYADLHSLFLGKEADGTRVPQPLPGGPSWFGCFDVVQLNEQEFAQLGGDPLAAAAGALAEGCRTLCVTLGSRGAAYFARSPEGAVPATAAEAGVPRSRSGRASPGSRTIRSGRIALEPGELAPVEDGDPTGCGDVFGSTACAALLAGASLEDALRRAVRMAARNVSHRGASGLRDHLLGHLSTA